MGHRSKCKMENHKTFKENIGENLCDLGLSKDFLGMTPKAQPNKEKNCIKFVNSSLRKTLMGA